MPTAHKVVILDSNLFFDEQEIVDAFEAYHHVMLDSLCTHLGQSSLSLREKRQWFIDHYDYKFSDYEIPLDGHAIRQREALAGLLGLGDDKNNILPRLLKNLPAYEHDEPLFFCNMDEFAANILAHQEQSKLPNNQPIGRVSFVFSSSSHESAHVLSCALERFSTAPFCHAETQETLGISPILSENKICGIFNQKFGVRSLQDSFCVLENAHFGGGDIFHGGEYLSTIALETLDDFSNLEIVIMAFIHGVDLCQSDPSKKQTSNFLPQFMTPRIT